MKKKITTLTIAFLMASLVLASCSIGKGDSQDRNLEHAILTRLNSVPNVQYVGKSDVRTLDNNRLQAVIIYYVADSIGNKIECNARVTTNDDCSEIYSWEDLDSNVLGNAKKMVSDRLGEKGISMDDSIIDVLIELKRR